MRPSVMSVFLSLMLIVAVASQAHAKRHALVIGNDNYEHVNKLLKAVNDARSMGDTLASIGFNVVRAANLSRRGMNQTIQRFTSQLKAGDEVLFFFAGHGVEINGRNFLLPTDIPKASPGQEGFVATEAIAVDTVLGRIRERGTRISVLVLDACRDNPFAKQGTRSLGGTRGLARMAAPEGTFIMYSAGVGQTALDRLSDGDPHPNSVFTRSLIPLLKSPGMSLTATARQVRRSVEKLASTVSHTQRPAYYDEVTGDFFFVKPSGKTTQSKPATSTTSQEDILWGGIENSTIAGDFNFYLRQFPNGKFAALAKLKLDRLEKAKPAKPKKPVREASDLRGNWTCNGSVTNRCLTMKCSAKVAVTERLTKTKFSGRSNLTCTARAKRGCRLPAGVKRKTVAAAAVTGELKGKRVQVTLVMEPPNTHLSSISEYELKGDKIIYKRDLQGESNGWRESCTWAPNDDAGTVARQ